MNYLTLGLSIIIPYIIYKLLLKWLENNYGLEINKFFKALIFISVDLIIIMLTN
ncbi:MAG: hypothetical protein PHQ89_00290 [Bacilli bacterium]|nr:hypothetical protein [Bacilli bacterium]